MWNEKHEKAMSDIKSLLIKDLVLQYPDPTKMMGIDTDASDAGIPGILFQVDDENREPLLSVSVDHTLEMR
jgi:hypothetical protein